MGLWADFLTNRGKITDKWSHYFPVYERHFARYVNTDALFVEIGCFKGGSLQMWKRYLGPHARIVGIDIRPACAELAEDQIDIRIGDQADATFLRGIVEEFGPPDVVLDDGSHKMDHQHASFATLYPLLAPNGVYAVEDVHTSYWEDYGGGARRKGTFVETCKALVDELNADHSRGAIPPTPFTRSTLSMHFYDGIVVFEKGRHAPNRRIVTGRDPAARKRRRQERASAKPSEA